MWRSVAVVLFLAVFLIAPSVVVHCVGPAQAQSPKQKLERTRDRPPQIHHGTDGLPQPVRDLRDAMLEAIQSGRIEELRYVYELNDLKPDLGAPAGADPVAHWKKLSGDGEGREILAVLSLLLDSGYVVVPLGADPENNRLYIWPYFAEVSIRELTPAQEVELLRLVSPAKAREMKAAGRYAYWRLSVGADGSWHSFRTAD
jgi:hypothetical protein